jgi:hypothetical protein
MKKHPFSPGASFSIMFEKVSRRRISPCSGAQAGCFPYLYYIYNSNGIMTQMTQSPVCRGFLRVIIRVIKIFIPMMTHFRPSCPRHYQFGRVITFPWVFPLCAGGVL